MITKKDIVIGNTNSKFASFSENKAKNRKDLGDYILKTDDNGSIKILGKSIEIKGNDTSDSDGYNYGLFKTINGSINIGDDNTEKIVVTKNKTKDSAGVHYDVALMMTDSGDINFKAKNKIDFNLERNIGDNNYYSKALMTTDGNINFKSVNLSIAGNLLINNTDESNLEKFASGKKLILDINNTSIF